MMANRLSAARVEHECTIETFIPIGDVALDVELPVVGVHRLVSAGRVLAEGLAMVCP